MTRKDFDDAMVVALRDMGDDSFEHNDPNWDDDYSKMKKLSQPTFDAICKSMVKMWWHSRNSSNN